MYKIPNIALGKVRHRHITRLFFPRLYQSHGNPAIPTSLLEDLYDKCILPTVRKVIPEHATHWPVDYAAASRQFRDNKGQLHFSSIDVPQDRLDQFSQVLLEQLNRFEEFSDAYFLHELRGTKGGMIHSAHARVEREEKLQEMMEFLNISKLVLEQWWIDVGIEIHMAGHILQWTQGGHAAILQSILPGISNHNINRLLNSKTLFHLDRACQLTDLAGFRCEPSSQGKKDAISYINVYTTDKSATYQLHDGVFKRREPTCLFPNNIKRTLQDIDSMSQTFTACAGRTTGTKGLEGNARLEVRVKLSNSANVLAGLDRYLLDGSVVGIKTSVWW